MSDPTGNDLTWDGGEWFLEFNPFGNRDDDKRIGSGASQWHIYGGYFGNYPRTFRLEDAIRVIVRESKEYNVGDEYAWRIRNRYTEEIILPEALGI